MTGLATRRGDGARRGAATVGSAVLLAWAAVTVAFLALHLAPGDVITAASGDGGDVSQRARIAHEWGLDRPLIVQYGHYLLDLLHGDLGYSFVQGDRVSHILFGDQLWATVTLAGTALVVVVVVTPILAVLTAGRRGPLSGLVSGLELSAASAPTFWIGLVLIWVFAFTLRVLPVTSGTELQRLVLPGITVALPIAGVLSQVIRGGIERALEQPFAVTARARGVGPVRLRVVHGLRHALIPATTLAGWAISSLLTGTVVVEEVFGRAGLGTVTVDAVTAKDLPVVLAVALLTAAVYLGVNLVVDLALPLVDPRLKEGAR